MKSWKAIFLDVMFYRPPLCIIEKLLKIFLKAFKEQGTFQGKPLDLKIIIVYFIQNFWGPQNCNPGNFPIKLQKLNIYDFPEFVQRIMESFSPLKNIKYDFMGDLFHWS